MQKRKAGAISPDAKKAKQGGGLSAALLKRLDLLESSHSAFLAQAASDNMAAELKAEAARGVPAWSALSTAAALAASKGSSPSLASLRVDRAELAQRAERAERFQAELAAAPAAFRPTRTLVAVRAATGGTARGQSTSLEKEYLRLTSLPAVADVRPPRVLRAALEMVKGKWTQGCEYKYACDQLKSIRQDLTVQHVRSGLTVEVYQAHARIAMECGDWAEYRQCQSVLHQLFEEGLPGEREEFIAYGLLWAAAAGGNKLAHAMKEALASAPPELLAGAAAGQGGGAAGRFVGHALAVCRAFAANDYVAFLRHYEAAPRMVPYLMDLLLEKLRGRCYGAVLAAYQPTVPAEAVAAWLGYGPEQRKDAAAFLRGRGARVKEGQLDVKLSRAGLQQQQQQMTPG